MAIVNVKELEVEKYLLVGRRVWQLDFNADETRVYTTNGVSNDISIIDIESQRVIKSVAVGQYPWGVAIKDD